MSETKAPEAGTGQEKERGWRRWIWAAIAVVAAFLVGFSWQGLRAERLETRLEQTSQALAYSRLETTVASATFEAQRGSYETARRQASDFFTGLQGAIATAPPAARDDMSAALAVRDRVITLLSRNDPESWNMLSALHLRFRGARMRAEQELPLAGQ